MSRQGLLSRMESLAQFVAGGAGRRITHVDVAQPMTLTLEQGGVVVAVTARLRTRALTAVGVADHPVVQGARLPVTLRSRPWRTRGGRTVEPKELVDAIRNGWPGIKALCDKSMFDTHNEGINSWLKDCMSMGLLIKAGKGYALGPISKGEKS
jgi:hypothetical protein